MHIDTFFSENLSCFDKQLASQKELFVFLSEILSDEVGCESKAILEKLNEREAISSTYIGNGIAIPHCRMKDVPLLKIAFVKLKTPIPVKKGESLEELQYVFSIVVNESHDEFYIAVLARLTRFLMTHSQELEKTGNYEELVNTLNSFSDSLSNHLNAYEISTQVPAIFEETRVKEAVDIMKRNQIDTLPVVDTNNRVSGIITITDLFKASLPEYVFYLQDFSFLTEFHPLENFWQNEEEMIVKEYMQSSTEYFVQAKTSYLEVLFLMSKHQREQLIVIDTEGLYKGVITPETILNTMLRP